MCEYGSVTALTGVNAPKGKYKTFAFFGRQIEVLLYDTLVLCFCKYRTMCVECQNLIKNVGLKVCRGQDVAKAMSHFIW